MNYKIEKFGDGICHSIKQTDQLYYFLREQLLKGFGEKIENINKFFKNKHFPGALPVTLTRKNIHLLTGHEFEDEEDEDFYPSFYKRLPYKIKRVVSDYKNDDQAFGPIQAWNRNYSQAFDLPNGKKCRKRKMFQNHYNVKRKSNGVRYLLMFSPISPNNFSEICQSLWNRKMECKRVKFKAPLGIHQLTIIDGELVKDNENDNGNDNDQYNFYPIDLIAKDHSILIDRTYADRKKLLVNFVDCIKKCPDTRESPFQIKLKTSASFSNLKLFIDDEQLHHLGDENTDYTLHKKHPSDGLIFDNDDDIIVRGTNSKQLKWKPLQFQTAELEIRLSEHGNYCHFYENTKEGVKFRFDQHVKDTFPLSSGDVHYAPSAHGEIYHKKIVECRYCRKTKFWKIDSPEKIRHDKTLPNFTTTINDVIQAIEDNITLDELIILSQKSRYDQLKLCDYDYHDNHDNHDIQEQLEKHFSQKKLKVC